MGVWICERRLSGVFLRIKYIPKIPNVRLFYKNSLAILVKLFLPPFNTKRKVVKGGKIGLCLFKIFK